MSAVVWANILLAVPFLIAFIGIPLWLTFKRPQTGPDHTQARAYLRTKAAYASAVANRTTTHGTRTLTRTGATATRRGSLAHQHAPNPAERVGASA